MAKRKRANGEGTIVKRPDGRYQASITVGYDDQGKQKRRYAYARTKSEVAEKLQQMSSELRSGVTASADTTVAVFFQQWLEYKRPQLKPRSVNYYENLFRRFVGPGIGRLKLSRLEPSGIRVLLVDVQTTTSTDAANKVRTLVRMLTKQAYEDQLIPRDPARPVQRLRNAVEPKKKPQLWTSDETIGFLETARTHRLYASFHLAIATGLRHGELLGLRWSDIDGDELVVNQTLATVKNSQVAFGVPKTKAGRRTVVLDEETKDVLEAHRQRQLEEREFAGDAWAAGQAYDDLVFTNGLGGHLNPRNFDRVWYRLRDQAGVPKIRFHDLRHLHVSLLADAGESPLAIADRIGHSDPAFTMKMYAHVFESTRRRMARPLKELLN